MFFIGGVTAAAASFLTKRSELAMWITCVVWVTGAVVWVSADLSNWWGPDPSVGLIISSVLGSAMVLGRFRAAASARTPPS
jgi:hypothetical protein